MSRRRSLRAARSIPLLTFVVKIWPPRTRHTCGGSGPSTTSARSMSYSPPRRPSGSAATRHGSWSSADRERRRPRRWRRRPELARMASPPSTARRPIRPCRARRSAGRQAMANVDHETVMREELAGHVGSLLAGVSADAGGEVGEDHLDEVLGLADPVTRCRTAVERDYQRNPMFAHALEMPTRF